MRPVVKAWPWLCSDCPDDGRGVQHRGRHTGRASDRVRSPRRVTHWRRAHRAHCYIGPFASLRGDLGRVEVREGSNIQDGCVLHAFPGRSTVVGVDGHVGHGAILHGCETRPGVLIGMNAVLMDEVVVGARAFVGAHSFVRSGTIVPEGWLVAGSPAQEIRPLTEVEMNWKAHGTVVYQQIAARSLATMRRVEPLTEVEDDRPSLSVDGTVAQPLSEYRVAHIANDDG